MKVEKKQIELMYESIEIMEESIESIEKQIFQIKKTMDNEKHRLSQLLKMGNYICP